MMTTRTLLAIGLSLGLLACKGKDDDDDDDGSDDDGGTTDQTGVEIYEDNCAACHGSDGEGTGGRPDLNVRIPLLDDDGLESVLTDGTGSMPMPVLNGAEENVLFEYLRDRFGEYGGS